MISLKALVQRRTREAHALAQFFDGPLVRGRIVHDGECAPDESVAQAREPAAAFIGQYIDVTAHGIDEHHLAHAFEHRFAARPLVTRFDDGLLHEVINPALRARFLQMQEARQRRDQRIERTQIAAEKAAYEHRFIRVVGASIVARLDRVVGQREGQLIDLHRERIDIRFGANARRARNHMRVAVRKHDDVAARKTHRRFADERAQQLPCVTT